MEYLELLECFLCSIILYHHSCILAFNACSHARISLLNIDSVYSQGIYHFNEKYSLPLCYVPIFSFLFVQIYPDRAARREIDSLIIYCPNSARGERRSPTVSLLETKCITFSPQKRMFVQKIGCLWNCVFCTLCNLVSSGTPDMAVE